MGSTWKVRGTCGHSSSDGWPRQRFHALCIASLATFLPACGARSGLRVPDIATDTDAAPIPNDADDLVSTLDRVDVPEDAPEDEAAPVCVDGGVQFIYLISQQQGLFSYYPPSSSIVRIGTIACPVESDASPSPQPYSMAVARDGTAYVIFDDGHLYRVSTANAHCTTTPFAPNQRGFLTFGMGFAGNRTDPGETLYVAQGSFSATSRGLGAIDLGSFALRFIGRFSVTLDRVELTGTADGRLFGFSLYNDAGSTVAEIDPTNANVLSNMPIAVGSYNNAFAFAFWGGDLYFFTAPDSGRSTTVTRYRRSDGSLVPVATLAETIVGAGVSTCAPQ